MSDHDTEVSDSSESYDFLSETDMSGSIASIDFNHDDIRSLGDNDETDEESHNDQRSRISSPPPTYEGLEQGSMHTPMQQSMTVLRSSWATDTTITRSIDLERPQSHIVEMTITETNLSTKDPLRVLYTGDKSAREAIIRKISMSIAASVVETSAKKESPTSTPLNVVPFQDQADEINEIEQPQSCGFELHVKDCLTATNLVYEDYPEQPHVIKLSLSDSLVCHSVPEGNNFILVGNWPLPHVAIIYCSKGDLGSARRTRLLTSEFMLRHRIPVIVITEFPCFKQDDKFGLDSPHVPHMYLGSDNGMAVTENIQRVPIDLAGFLQLDATQLNRNLAFLTGTAASSDLHDTEGVHEPSDEDTDHFQKDDNVLSGSIGQTWSVLTQHGSAFRVLGHAVLGLLVAALATQAMLAFPMYQRQVTINGSTSRTEPKTMVREFSTLSSGSLSSSPTTISPSFSTVAIATSESSVSYQNPVPRFRPTDPLVPVFKPDKKVCDCQVIGTNEVLVKIPSSTLTTWLGSDALSLSVSRYDQAVSTERVYGSKDGIILSFPQHEAYGRLNITIITSKKPKVNETFEVDFGLSFSNHLSNMWYRAAMFRRQTKAIKWRIYQTILDSGILNITASQLALVRNVTSQSTAIAGQKFESIRKDMSDLGKSSKEHIAQDVQIVRSHLSTIKARVQVQSMSFAARLQSAPLQLANVVSRKAADTLLRAQFESKLLYLKITGQHERHDSYASAIRKMVSARYKVDRLAAYLARIQDTSTPSTFLEHTVQKGLIKAKKSLAPSTGIKNDISLSEKSNKPPRVGPDLSTLYKDLQARIQLLLQKQAFINKQADHHLREPERSRPGTNIAGWADRYWRPLYR